MSELLVIGIEPGGGLDDRRLGALRRCRCVFGPARLLALARPLDLPCFEIAPIGEALTAITGQLERGDVAVLSGGDPLFFGIGKTLIEKFGRDRVTVLPAVSSMQLAFARLGINWDDARFMSVHGRDRDDPVAQVHCHSKLCILTGGHNPPQAIAARLVQADVSGIEAHVLENLGLPGERMTSGTLADISKGSFGELSLLVLLRSAESPETSGPAFGLTETEIRHSRGLITKDEIRAAVLHALRLPQSGNFWDIGAGSGSVSVEAARLSSGLRVFAIEKDRDHLQNIRVNVSALAPGRVTVVEGEAPASCGKLPAPDRVFIGGSGGRMSGIIELVAGCLNPGGIVVVTAVTEKTRQNVPGLLADHGFTVRGSTISVTRSRWIDGSEDKQQLNPITIFVGEK